VTSQGAEQSDDLPGLIGGGGLRARFGIHKFSAVAGVVGLLGMLAGPFLLILTDHGGVLAERVALYPLIIWLIVLGGKKLLADRPRR
jgi:hypothetical protein